MPAGGRVTTQTTTHGSCAAVTSTVGCEHQPGVAGVAQRALLRDCGVFWEPGAPCGVQEPLKVTTKNRSATRIDVPEPFTAPD